MSFLLDTNVISELRKPPKKQDPNVAAWRRGVSSSETYLSVLVIGELRQGVERAMRTDRAKGAVLDAWLEKVIRQFTLAEHILPVDDDVAQAWGRMNVPDPLPAIDSLQAATAHVHGLTFVSRDVDSLVRTGVPLLNPWLPPPHRP